MRTIPTERRGGACTSGLARRVLRKISLGIVRRLRSLHGNQQGTISILSVFAVMLLTMLLGMVMNVGRHVDGKLRMQNAADAAAYSGGVVIARGMNTLAFTNHLLCDVFAVTAFLREARDRNAESYVSQILAAWNEIGPVFASSGFPKFDALGSAILQKVPLEQDMVRTYGDWAASVSSQVLPMMEDILSNELIPKYQRAVVEAFPDIAQTAAMQSAARNADPDHGRGKMLGVLWRASGQPIGVAEESSDRTFPVVDPVMDNVPEQSKYMSTARQQREVLSHTYLNQWNNEAMHAFDVVGKMGQFGGLWRSFTCGQLEKLLNEEYPNSNLPFVIVAEKSDIINPNEHLEKYYTFISVTYWKRLPEMLPGLFRNPMEADAEAYAEVHLMIPRGRLVWTWLRDQQDSGNELLGAVPGESAQLPGDGPVGPQKPEGPGRWIVARQGVPTDWNLLNQSWNCQLAPATQPALATILQTRPSLPAFQSADLTLPNLGDLTTDNIERISPH